MQKNKRINTRAITMTAILSAAATILQMFEFNVPIMPSFLKLDFSDLPAMLAAFAFGPVSGIAVCLVKNVVNLFISTSAGIGSLANFLTGAVMVGVAGLIYRRGKNRKSALIGSVVGALSMGLCSLLINYFIVYPVYAKLFGGMDKILLMYSAILPQVNTLWSALLIFNLPFTIVRGLLTALITFVIYKKLSPLLKGKI